ncbi:L,D-transpeptidase family protein [Enorma phocaeensis]|uniref:L,D-transpeptidase family protein n=1 Tax=Enorma phocaeensis TaxID=1871019 RepID=UPI00320AAA2D
MEIKLFKGKRPAVVAGMIATAGLGMALTAAPAVAAADELPRDGQAPAVEQGTLPSGAGSSDQVASGSLPDGSQGSDAVEPGGDATGSGSVAGNGEQGDPEQSGGETGNAPRPGDGGQTGGGEQVGSEVPGGETAADNEEQGEGEQPGDDIVPVEPGAPAVSNDVLANEVPTAGLPAPEADHAPGWGVDGRYYNSDGSVATGWLVTSERIDGTEGDIQRYWLGDDGSFLADRAERSFEAVLETGASGLFRLTSDGWVLRGWSGDGLFCADNDGRLWTGWAVTGELTGGRLERYWFDEETGEMARGRLVGESEGDASGYYAWALDDGRILRGKWDDGAGHVYVADNDGRLATAGTADGTGWLVTDRYDGGFQRYRIEWGGKGVGYYAHSGYFSAPSERGGAARNYFGLGGEGYVLRGVGKGVYGDWLMGDNDGALATGWVVTGEFGTGGRLERYWFDSSSAMAKGRLVGASEGDASGYYAWALDDGRILRGKWDDGAGHVYVADNDGRLATAGTADGTGWLVTDRYDGGFQRYRIEWGGKGVGYYAHTGFFWATPETGGASQRYFGVGGQGYILRGTTPWWNVMLIANNDGVLVGDYGSTIKAEHSNGNQYYGNWVVTDEFTGDLQRYFITGVEGQSGFFGGLIGKFSIGKNADGEPIEYYGRNDTGYVVRGSYRAPDGTYYYANNDGVLDNFVMLDGGQLTDVGRRIWDAIMNKSSNTQYLIAVDRIACRTVVFQGGAGNWKPIYDWGCATGNPKYNSGNGTIVGEFQIGGQPGSWADHRWTGAAGENYAYDNSHYRTENWVGQGVTYFTGFILNCGFHSTAGNHSDPSQLGQRISHGCIRLLEKNAQWIFHNAGLGTKVIILPDNY